MNRKPIFWCCVAAGALLTAADVRAQGGPPPARTGAAPSTLGERDPVVLAILESNPATPARLVEAAMQLLVLERPGLAKQMLGRLLASKPAPDALAAAARQLGSQTFIKMRSEARLAPEGQQVARLVMEAASRQTRDPRRIARLIDQLADPSARVRRTATAQLQEAYDAALVPLVAALADDSKSQFHAHYQQALAAFGTTAIGPLAGALESRDAKLRARAAEVLGRIGSTEAVNYLVGPLASRSEPREVREAALRALKRISGGKLTRPAVEKYLHDRVVEHLENKVRLPATHDDRVTLWHWDRRNNRVYKSTYFHDDAVAVIAARLGRYLYQATPSDELNRRLYLTSLLKAAQLVVGRDKPLPTDAGTPYAVAAKFGAEVIEDVLRWAMQTNQPVAATAAARILGDVGTEDLLHRGGSSPAPLVRAARHADRRLRFAAAEAMMKLAPTRAYAGSNYLTEALGFFAGSYSSRRVLVAHPVTARAQRLAGSLMQEGFEADTAASGREVFQLAKSTPDYELLMISYVVTGPRIEELLQELRRDRRTASLPVGLLATESNDRHAQQIARADPLVEAYPWPLTREGAKFYADRLLALVARDMVPREARGRQAEMALAWLAQLADTAGRRRVVYDLRKQEAAVLRALHTPQLAEPAAEVLGKLGSAAAQQALVDLASQQLQPLEVRRAASRAFSESVFRHGTMLTAAEIQRQYDRYNASRDADKETQVVLALLLDTIERRAQRP